MKIIALLLLLNLANPETEIIDNQIIPVSGLVVEEATGEPLPGAMIHIDGIKEKYYTDFDGTFLINELKPGTYDIEISYVSFDMKKLTEVQIDRKNNSLFVSLK